MTEINWGPDGENVLVRHINTTSEKLWDLWTTPDGISAWWGPADSRMVVEDLDLRQGGRLSYKIHIERPDHRRQADKMGAPTILNGDAVYLEVVPRRRLLYRHLTDFFPGVEPYWNTIAVDIHEPLVGEGVGMVVTWSPLHDAKATKAAAWVWDNELAVLTDLAEG